MNELIKITSDEQGSLLVDSIDFAAGLDIQHKNLLESIKTHQQAIEADFGLIAFETRKIDGKGRPETYALLTEDQAMFVGTLSRNSARVIAFKSVLVRSFAEARKKLLSDAPAPTPALPSQTEQLMLQLMQQQAQLMSGQQLMLEQLRADVSAIQAGQRPVNRNTRPVTRHTPALPMQQPARSLRKQFTDKVNEYCARYDVYYDVAYNHMYDRLYKDFNFNVNHYRVGTEKPLDTVERYGKLMWLISIVDSELAYTEE